MAIFDERVMVNWHWLSIPLCFLLPIIFTNNLGRTINQEQQQHNNRHHHYLVYDIRDYMAFCLGWYGWKLTTQGQFVWFIFSTLYHHQTVTIWTLVAAPASWSSYINGNACNNNLKSNSVSMDMECISGSRYNKRCCWSATTNATSNHINLIIIMNMNMNMNMNNNNNSSNTNTRDS